MEYPEYHTSLDNLDFVTPAGLQGALNVLMMTIKLLECNKIYRVKCYGEPQLGKRGLYPTLGTKQKHEYIFDMLNFIAYADGENDLIDISNIIKVPAKRLYPIVQDLLDANLIAEV